MIAYWLSIPNSFGFPGSNPGADAPSVWDSGYSVRLLFLSFIVVFLFNLSFFFFVCFFSGFLGESRHLQRPDYIFGQQGLHRSDIYRSASRVIVTIKRCRCMPGIEIKANTMNVWMKNALILGVEALASNLIHQAQRVLSTHHPHHYLPPHYSPPQHPQANPQIAAPDSSQPSSPH